MMWLVYMNGPSSNVKAMSPALAQSYTPSDPYSTDPIWSRGIDEVLVPEGILLASQAGP